MYRYGCTIERIVDGDTIDVSIDLGFDMWMNRVRVRLIDVDTPEVRTRDPIEKWLGQMAADTVEKLLPVGSRTVIISKEYNPTDIYNRILADFVVPSLDMSLTEFLLNGRYAARYYSKDRERTLNEHKENREYWLNLQS